MKKSKIKGILSQEDNFDKFYNDENNEIKEKEVVPKGYDSLAELNYYGDDKDFMRFHKRTK